MFLDTAVLIKLVIREPDSFFYAEQVEGQREIWISQLAFTESWSALYRKQREGSIDSRIRRSAWQKLERYWSGGMIQMLPLGEEILRRANGIIARCYPAVALRSLDAIHLASCEAADAFPLIANDRQMRLAAKLLHFPLGPLPPTV
jgi:predicted nucleic acid-binding protein